MFLSDISPKEANIINAAIHSIYELGVDQFKLRDVAAKAGVTTGAVTYYFDGKDELVIAAFNAVWQKLFIDIADYKGGWEISRFIHSLPTSEEKRKGWSVWLAFCGRAQASNELNSHYQVHYDKLEQHLLGTISEKSPWVSLTDIRLVIAAMDGIGLCATLNPKHWPKARQIESLQAMVGHLFTEGRNALDG